MPRATVFSAFSFIALMAVFSPSFASASMSSSAKPTVCSITINSSEEIEAFKKVIGEKNANFVELTNLPDDEPETSSDSSAHWLKRACKAKIKCDTLVISGHFGGGFFGSSGHTLSMEELEGLSCDAGCDGVLQAPKEVFLFGCNTLAGKKPDRRTPEEYRRVLVEDGFSNEQAEQVVAFRYSPLGDTFNERMRRVFRGAKRIYGFDSIAPSGKNVQGPLLNYLKAATKQQYYTPARLEKLDEKTNELFIRSLKGAPVLQVSGASNLDRQQIPACFLNNEKIPFFHKLNWIEKNLNSDRSFTYLPTINDYLAGLTKKNHEWKDKEFEVLERVTYNRKLRDDLSGIVRVRDSAMLGMQLKILTFMQFFGWVHPKDYAKRVEQLLIGDLNQPFTIERKDQICSYAYANSLKVRMEESQIPSARWRETSFVHALRCIGLYSDSLMEKALGLYFATEVKDPLKAEYLSFVQSLTFPPEAAPRVYSMIFSNGEQILNSDREALLCKGSGSRLQHPWIGRGLHPTLKNQINYLKTVGCYLPASKENLDELISLLESSGGKSLQSLRDQAIIGSLLEMQNRGWLKSLSPALQKRLVEVALQRSMVSAMSILANLPDISPSIQKSLETFAETLAAKPATHAFRDLEKTLLGDSSKRAEQCLGVLKRAHIALEAKQRVSVVFLLNQYAASCLAHVNTELSAEFDRVALSVFNLVDDSDGERIYSESSPEELLQMSETHPESLVEAIVYQSKPVLRSLRQAQGLMTLNTLTVSGRLGGTAQEEDILKLADPVALKIEIKALLKSPDVESRKSAHKLLSAIQIDDSELTETLLRRLQSSGWKGDDLNDLFNAFARQDRRSATILWLANFGKLKGFERDRLASSSRLFKADSPIFEVLAEIHAKKKMRNEVVADVIRSIATHSSEEFDLYRAKFRELGLKLQSPLLKSAIDQALMSVSTNQRECDERPRLCM